MVSLLSPPKKKIAPFPLPLKTQTAIFLPSLPTIHITASSPPDTVSQLTFQPPFSRQTVHEALKGALKLALIHDGLARGLREASKALDRRQAHVCVLNEACEEEAYKKLVKALCGEHSIPLIQVGDGKLLGEWAGLCEFAPFFFPNFCVAYSFRGSCF